MSAHLGPRTSALLDGQLSDDDTERAWQHVHGCHLCRDQVEREGWVKTRLAGMAPASRRAPETLKAGLLGMPPGDLLLAMSHQAGSSLSSRARRSVGFAAIGGGAAGAAVMGVLALGTAPADIPHGERRAPVTQVFAPGATTPRLPERTPQRPTG